MFMRHRAVGDLQRHDSTDGHPEPSRNRARQVSCTTAVALRVSHVRPDCSSARFSQHRDAVKTAKPAWRKRNERHNVVYCRDFSTLHRVVLVFYTARVHRCKHRHQRAWPVHTGVTMASQRPADYRVCDRVNGTTGRIGPLLHIVWTVGKCV